MWMRKSFNPRAREGRDGLELTSSADAYVSIHAPARGATPHHCHIRFIQIKFQSTRPRGARLIFINETSTTDKFQSTRPRGARRTSYPGDRQVYIVSIHAPARGATMARRIITTYLSFQSTRPRGARRVRHRCYPLQGLSVSIHAPARGATFDIYHGYFQVAFVSIHAPARGATLT